MRNVRSLAVLLALCVATGSVTSLAGERAGELRGSEALREQKHRLNEFRLHWPGLTDAQIQKRLREIHRALLDPEPIRRVPPPEPFVPDLFKSDFEDWRAPGSLSKGGTDWGVPGWLSKGSTEWGVSGRLNKDGTDWGVSGRLNKDGVLRPTYLFVAKPLRLKYVVSENSAEYLLIGLYDKILYRGDDQAKLAAVLNERLSNSPDVPLDIQMEGFSVDKRAALGTTFRIRQRIIDPSISIKDLSTREIRLERATIAVDSNVGGSTYRADLTFTGRLANRIRTVSVRLTSAALDVVLGFILQVHHIVHSPNYDKDQSLQGLIASGRRELKTNHRGLTDEQLRIEMIGQFGNIRIVDWLHAEAFSWS